MVGIVVWGNDPRNPFRDLGLTATVDITASIKGRQPIVTGVVYADANRNGLYDAGEGLRGVRVSVTGSGIKATAPAWETGGFSVPVKTSKAATVVVTATGPGLAEPLTRSVPIRPGMNARVNFVVPGG